jgi:hypothetical protein
LVVRDPKTVVVRGDTADGEYAIVVGIGQTAMEVGKIAVKGRPHYFGAPPVQSATDVRFGEGARLVGFDVSQGEGLHVVLYWQALAPMDRSYTVFVHLLDSAGNIAAQRDQIPGAGEFPTTGWVRGEYLADAYDLGLPRAGEFRVEVGLYDAATGQRLSAFDASGKNIGDHWILERTIRVP